MRRLVALVSGEKPIEFPAAMLADEDQVRADLRDFLVDAAIDAAHDWIEQL